MEIIKIVLTGGPCAGKTTALNTIKEYLAKRNIPVLTVPETATELILNGIIPSSEITTFDFQKLVLKKQMSKEEITEEFIENSNKKDDICVIIFDRGIIDNKAYLSSHDEFTRLLNQKGLSEIDILDSYDLVLDLLSTASCKEEAYNLHNKARFEDIETARYVDKRTTLAWIHHRNLKIISSAISLEEESKIIIDYVIEILSGIRTKKVRSFLVDNNASNYSIYNRDNSEELYITDYYLDVRDSKYNHVISRREHNGDLSYVYRIYSEEDGEIKIYHDKKLTLEEYFELLHKYGIIDISQRKEINFIYNKQRYRLCFYENYTVLEYEESKIQDEILFPNNLKISEEITKSNKKRKIRRKMDGNIQ